jgi:tetratricopeptide (TPR) repeat protein
MAILLLGSPVIGQKKADQLKQRIKQQQLNQRLNLARNYEQRAQFSRALEVYMHLWNDYPANINYYRGVKNNYINLQKFDLAEETINKMIRQNASVLIKVDLGDLYFKKGERKKAVLFWKKMVEDNKRNPSTFQIVASAMTRNFLYDEALALYKTGQELLNNKSLFLIEIANVYRSRRDFKNAVLYYLEYLKYFPKQYNFVEHNITSFAGDPETAAEIEKIILSKININNSPIELRNVLAAFYIRSSNYRAALDEYATIDLYIQTRSKKERDKVGKELFRFAENAYNDGAYEYAIQAYQLVLNRYPKSSIIPNSQYGIARAHEKLTQFEKAIEIYNKIIIEHKHSQYAKNSLFRIGEIQLESLSDPDAAEAFFKKVKQMRPIGKANVQAIFRIGDCYLKRNALDKAAELYEQVPRQKAASHHLKMKALFKLGKIFYWQGDFGSANVTFEKIVNDPINITNDQAGLYVNDALEHAMLIDENKDAEIILKKFALADLYVEQKKPESALFIYEEISQQDSAKKLLDDAYLNMGEMYFYLKNYNESLQAFQKLLTELPKSVYADVAQKSMGDVYHQGLQNRESALEAYELVLTNYPDSVYLEEVRKKIREIEKNVL